MNQNLSKLFAQLRDIWGQLGATQRLNVAAATFVLVAALCVLAFWSSRADYGLLYGGLSDADIQKMVKEAEANAGADKKRREFVETRNHADALVE